MRSLHLPFACAVIAVAFLVLPVTAQDRTGVGDHGPKSNGVPASVTSFGFGGQPGFHGVPASVTSLNFGNVSNGGAWRRPHVGAGDGHRHHGQGFVNPYYGGTYYVPYAYPVYEEPVADESTQSEEGQATILDRDARDQEDALHEEVEALRSTVREYRDELRATRVTEPPAPKPEPERPAVSQPETILVFKDGHQLQVVNYAIVGSTLFDLSEGRSKKVSLAELDLPATVKQNDDRGVEFRVPAAAAN